VPPSPAAFRRVLRRLDVQALAAAFGAWLAGQVLAGLADASSLVIALAGKSVRGARTGDGKAPHLLAAMIAGARAVIARKDTARYLAEEKGADYLFTAVKENQAGLFAALDALAREHAPIAHVMHDRGHGRHETRTIQVLPAPEGCFPHAAQAVLAEEARPRPARRRAPLVRRRARHHQSHRRQGRHPAALAGAVRIHRDAEALHHVRDVTMKEDASKLRPGTAPQIAATLRNTAIAALRLAGFTNMAAGRRWAARNPARTLAVLNLI
jgi:hypothetical protein